MVLLLFLLFAVYSLLFVVCFVDVFAVVPLLLFGRFCQRVGVSVSVFDCCLRASVAVCVFVVIC